MHEALNTNWFDPTRANVLVALLLFLSFLGINILRAKKSGTLYIRPLPGLAALVEAIGRATEMGKPILYMSGFASEVFQGGLLEAGAPFLAKPFTQEDLAGKVRLLLEAEP